MKAIATALVKAQKAFGPALKTSTNPHFRSRYADLSNCVEAVIDALNDNGIALIQNCHPCDNGVVVETIFVHESGEVLSCGTLHVPASKQDPQGYGSALTYARRYSLMAACGIAPEDDDGNAAKGKPNPLDNVRPAPTVKTELPTAPVTQPVEESAINKLGKELKIPGRDSIICVGDEEWATEYNKLANKVANSKQLKAIKYVKLRELHEANSPVMKNLPVQLAISITSTSQKRKEYLDSLPD